MGWSIMWAIPSWRNFWTTPSIAWIGKTRRPPLSDGQGCLAVPLSSCCWMTAEDWRSRSTGRTSTRWRNCWSTSVQWYNRTLIHIGPARQLTSTCPAPTVAFSAYTAAGAWFSKTVRCRSSARRSSISTGACQSTSASSGTFPSYSVPTRTPPT